MGLIATIHAISPTSYEAARRGDWSGALDPSVESIDLDKAWHAIHYLLTGNTELTFLLTGTQIEDVEEHCEVHSGDDLRSLQLKLASTSVAAIMSGFQAEDFDGWGIYPDGIWMADAAPYVAEHLERFLGKLSELVDGGLGMLVVIC